MTFFRDNSAKITHPEWIDGRRVWTDPEVQEIVDLIQKGDPTLGWEGDPFLALLTPDAHGRWELVRLDGDTYSTVARSRPGLKLDRGLIRHLVAHDMRRRTAQTILDEIDKMNAQIEKERSDALIGTLVEATEKVYWAANRDVGHHH